MKLFYLLVFILFSISVLAQENEKYKKTEGVCVQAKFSFEIKDKPDALSKSLAKGMKGDSVKITAVSISGYYCANYNGLSGYVNGLYLVSTEERDSFDVEIRKKLLVEKEKVKEKELNDVIQRSYDEFTGEVLITAKMNGPISFVKSISETGEFFIILKWRCSAQGNPENKRLQLIILFDDNSRLSISLPIVYEHDEFWSSFYLAIAIGSGIAMEPAVYRLNSEVLLTPLQIELLKNKTIKKYRLEGYEGHDEDLDSKIIFNKLLKAQ